MMKSRWLSSPSVAGSLGSRVFSSAFSSFSFPPSSKLFPPDFQRFRDFGHCFSMVTAFSTPSAAHAEAAGIEAILVGDSLGMVELGYSTTLPVTMSDMISRCQAVSRGASRPLLIGDLPFGAYEGSKQQAHRNAVRFIKEGGMDAVKVEVGSFSRVSTISSLVAGGLAVVGHVGLTPQRISALGGFRAQGRTAAAARELIQLAQAVEAAGAFCLVVECVPGPVARALTSSLSIPTVGIGAGPDTSGQVLVYHDIVGMVENSRVPPFSLRFASVGAASRRALEDFRAAVETRKIPDIYKMKEGEEEEMRRWLASRDR